jgi:hypothetical protein
LLSRQDHFVGGFLRPSYLRLYISWSKFLFGKPGFRSGM